MSNCTMVHPMQGNARLTFSTVAKHCGIVRVSSRNAASLPAIVLGGMSAASVLALNSSILYECSHNTIG